MDQTGGAGRWFGPTPAARVTYRAKILFVNDDLQDAAAGFRHLTEAGFDPVHARSFLEALPYLGAGRVELVLVALPQDEWTRTAMLTQIRRANPSVPIVAMASIVSEDLGEHLASFRATPVPRASRERWRDTMAAIGQALEASELDGTVTTGGG